MAERSEVKPADAAPEKAPPTEAPPPVEQPVQARLAGKLGFIDHLFLAIDNPVLRRELLTALRSNKAFILHFCFLFIIGAVVWMAWPEETTARSQKARTLFKIFAQAQMVLMSVLAPAFSASALTIEKEKRALDLLLTSPISAGTIVMGKYLSSVLYLILLILSTAPIMSVVNWQPGIDTREMIGLYILLISIAASFTMIGLTCSTFFDRSQVSLSITYLVVLPLALLLLVFSAVFDGFYVWSSAIWPSGMLLIATVIMYQACIRRLKQPFDPVHKAAEEEDISTQTGLVLVRDRFPDNLLAPPRDNALLPEGSNPMYQKEIRSEIFGRGTLFLRLIIQIAMFLSVVFLTFLYLQREHIFVDYLAVFTMLVGPAFACNAFTQERERGTLDLVLTTLVQPGQIVWGKFLACCRLAVFLTALVGVTLLFYLLVGGKITGQSAGEAFMWRVVYFGVYLLILFATILLETSLGMCMSMLCRSTLQSMIVTYTIVLLLFGAPMALQALLYLSLDNAQNFSESIAWASFTSPFEAIYSVAPKIQGNNRNPIIPTVTWPAYVGFCFVVSGILMGYVVSSFERWATKTAKWM